MQLMSTLNGPVITGSSALLHECLYLRRASGPQRRDNPVEYKNKGYYGNYISKEEVPWRSPEVEGSDEQHENAHAEHGYKRGNGSFLEFENPVKH